MKRMIFRKKTPFCWRGQGNRCMYQIERKNEQYVLRAGGVYVNTYNTLIDAMQAAEVDNEKNVEK